jgi:hypothetical protein
MYETIKQIGQKKLMDKFCPRYPLRSSNFAGSVRADVETKQSTLEAQNYGGSKLWGEIVGEKTMKQFSSDICSSEHFFQHMQFDSLRVELLF